jgi:hypothetical protein
MSILLCPVWWPHTPLRASFDAPRRRRPKTRLGPASRMASSTRRRLIRWRAAGRPGVLAVLAVGPGRTLNFTWGSAGRVRSGVGVRYPSRWGGTCQDPHGGFGLCRPPPPKRAPSNPSACPVSRLTGHRRLRRWTSQSEEAAVRDEREDGRSEAHGRCGRRRPASCIARSQSRITDPWEIEVAHVGANMAEPMLKRDPLLRGQLSA